jgi:valyl-tRNA synthetase
VRRLRLRHLRHRGRLRGRAGSFWHVRYAIADAEGNPTGEDIVIATTRPETIPADTAVAVNPEDDRYRHLIGLRAIVPAGGRLVPIIGDSAVSIEGGSGALKVTPGHDPTDFEIGERHGLEIISHHQPDGTLNEHAGQYAGLERFEARKQDRRGPRSAGRIEKIEPYTHAVGHCQRSGTIVEPLISLQWWVDAKTLAKPSIEAVTSGAIKFVPERFERTYLHWMENIRDWCISRQIWWGHRIPVWYCDACEHLTVAIETPRLRGLRLRRHPPGRGHARHLVLLGPLAALHARLAGGDGDLRASTRRRSWRPATTSSSSGSPAW